jgi:hypothetical protein
MTLEQKLSRFQVSMAFIFDFCCASGFVVLKSVRSKPSITLYRALNIASYLGLNVFRNLVSN